MGEKNKNENQLDNFLQGAYGRTVAVSHNNNCTFHSMGRNVLEMYLDDKKDGIQNGLGERIIKKLIKKHENKLENPVWAHAGWHPFGSFAYRKSFLESVKYYFSNATWGWFNLINPFFWLSELIWGEYANDFYSVYENQNNEIELHIDNNLSDNDKYRIGNILGQLIREEIADAIAEEKNHQQDDVNLDTSDIYDFVNVNTKSGSEIQKKSDETDKLKINPKKKTELSYKRKMTKSIIDASPGKKFDIPYVDQGSTFIVCEWQYLTSNDFLEDQNLENQNNNSPAKAIILEVNQYPISFTSAKIVLINNEQPETLSCNDNDEKAKIIKILTKLPNDSQKTLICVIGKGYLIGRCQPIVSSKNKENFINQLLDAIKMPSSNPGNKLGYSPKQKGPEDLTIKNI